MNTVKKIIALLCGLMLVLFIAACEDEGPAEKAGEKIDNAVESTQESMEEAGDKLEEQMEEAGDKIEETGDKIQEKTN